MNWFWNTVYNLLYSLFISQFSRKTVFCVTSDFLIVFLVPDLIWFLFWISLSLLICIWYKSFRFLHNSLNHLLLTIFQKTTWQFTVCFWILIWFSVYWFSRFHICLQCTDSVWLILYLLIVWTSVDCILSFFKEFVFSHWKASLRKRLEKGSIHPPSWT